MKKVNDFIFKYILEPVIKLFGTALILIVMLQIFGRSFMKTPPSWTEEMSRFTFVWYSFLACAITLRAKQHLGLDYFYQKFNVKFRHVVDWVIQLLTLAFGVYTAYYGTTLLSVVGRRKAPITGWTMNWFYLVMPVMGVLFVLIALENLQALAQKKPEEKEGTAE